MAKLYGPVKTIVETIGAMSLRADLGITLGGLVLTDASATLSSIRKKDIGKSRDIQTNYLWIQDDHEINLVGFERVAGSENCAGLLSQNLPGDTMDNLMSPIDVEFADGQDERAYSINNVEVHSGVTTESLDVNCVLPMAAAKLKDRCSKVCKLTAWQRIDDTTTFHVMDAWASMGPSEVQSELPDRQARARAGGEGGRHQPTREVAHAPLGPVHSVRVLAFLGIRVRLNCVRVSQVPRCNFEESGLGIVVRSNVNVEWV